MPRHGIFLAPFNAFADPKLVASLGHEAEKAGWDGLFLWDHVLRRPEQARQVADPFVCLSAVALATSRLRIGTMVTPIVRRRPQVLARQVVTLDCLADGRFTLGLGLGVDSTGELSRFGEVTDPVARGAILDEGAALLAELLAGEPVDHDGPYFKARGVQFLPTGPQQPRLPIWLAASEGRRRPLRRAARYEGAFLIGATPDQLRASVAFLTELRGSLEGFEVAVLSDCGLGEAEMDEIGVSWSMYPVAPEADAELSMAVVKKGPGAIA